MAEPNTGTETTEAPEAQSRTEQPTEAPDAEPTDTLKAASARLVEQLKALAELADREAQKAAAHGGEVESIDICVGFHKDPFDVSAVTPAYEARFRIPGVTVGAVARVVGEAVRKLIAESPLAESDLAESAR